MGRRLVSLTAVLFVISGCGATTDQLAARASFDLGCPKEKLDIVRLDDRTRGVTGCGQKVTYVESCSSGGNLSGGLVGMAKQGCTWVLNASSTSGGTQ
jgi:hypothetical protein